MRRHSITGSKKHKEAQALRSAERALAVRCLSRGYPMTSGIHFQGPLFKIQRGIIKQGKE